MANPLDKLLAGGDAASEESDGSSEEDAAKDMLVAIKRGDAKALSLALKRHYEACEASKDEPAAADDEDDSEDY